MFPAKEDKMITGIVYKTRPCYAVVWEMIAMGTLQVNGKEQFACLYVLLLNSMSAWLGPVPAWFVPKMP